MSTQDTKSGGDALFFVLALVIVAALVVGFLMAGLAGVTLVMIAATALSYVVLVILSVGS